MADWQVGDLALCVRGGPLVPEPFSLNVAYPEAGKCYDVVGRREFAGWGLYLYLDGAPDNIDAQCNWGPLWDSVRFIKVTPDAADAFDREVIAALTPAPQEVGDA